MDRYSFWIKIEDKKLESIFQRIAKATEEIQQCYAELRGLNVVTLGKEEDSPCTKEQGGRDHS